MKSTVRFMPLLAVVLAILTVAFLMAEDTQPNDLTIHEWGTFTSVAGEDGNAIDWDALGCKNDLPQFVNDYGYRGFKWRLQGTVRMETPVMYFYTPRELTAHVRVEFPQGLITEWYPRAEYKLFQRSRVDGSMRLLATNLNGIDTSLRSLKGAIEWSNIDVQPGAAPTLPVENGPARYYAARQTDSAPITVSGQSEKFLFYRGVGRFAIPLSARISDGGKIRVENRVHEPVPTAILFENRGGRMGYRIAGPIEDAFSFERPVLDSALPGLLQNLENTLVEQGLFRKEAHAMVETWQDSWFEEGSRLIYILPTSEVNAVLPLQVEPAPSQIARVFVGRIELITPETEHAVESAIAQSDWPALARYSRFLEPTLQRLYANDASQARNAEQSLREFRASVGACRSVTSSY
jgi:hypothetical protein